MIKDIVLSINWVFDGFERQRLKLCGVILLILFSSLLSIGEVVYLQYALENVAKSSNKTGLMLILFFSAMTLLHSAVDCVQRYYCLGSLQNKLQEKLSSRIVKNIFSMSLQKFKAKEKTYYVDLLTKDIESISNIVCEKLINLSSVFQVILLLYLLLSISISMLPIAIFLVLAYIFLGKKYMRRFMQACGAYMEHVDILHRVTEEGISANREIIAYNQEKWEKQRRINTFKEYYKKTIKMYTMGNIHYFVTNILKYTLIAFVLIYGGYLVTQGKISVASFVILYRLYSAFLDSATRVSEEAASIGTLVVQVNRIREYVEEVNTKRDVDVLGIDTINSVEFCGVGFRYDDSEKDVIRDVSFLVTSENKVAFVGPSGGGKTTILKLLLGLLQPTKGCIKINGVDLREIDHLQWTGKNVAACFQESFLFPDTVENNILLGKNLSEEQIDEICKITKFNRWLEKQTNGYSAQIGDRGISLSGGERQRLALTRLLAQNPQLYMFDESTSSIDIATEKAIWKAIDGYLLEKNSKIFVVSHRIDVVKDADIIYVINEGEIEETGKHDELIDNGGLYSKLCEEKESA